MLLSERFHIRFKKDNEWYTSRKFEDKSQMHDYYWEKIRKNKPDTVEFHDQKAKDRHKAKQAKAKKAVKEETEIQELSHNLLKTYVDKAEGDATDKKSVAHQATNLKKRYEGEGDKFKAQSAHRVASKLLNKANKRVNGLKLARTKLKNGD